MYEDQDASIPFHRTDVIRMCIEDGQLSTEQAKTFREFCEMLSAYYHFKFHAFVETLKQNYRPFDPSAPDLLDDRSSPEQRNTMATQMVRTFQTVMENAHYTLLANEHLPRAIEDIAIIGLKTDIDFEDLDTVVCYYRGETTRRITFKRFFKRVRKTIHVFDRVAILIKFKDAEHFRAKQIHPRRLKFEPGKIYIYLYKNIPKFDLSLLFPTVKTSMTWMDQLLISVPAVGALVPLVLRVLPQLFLILGLVFFFLGMPSVLEWLQISEEDARGVLPVLVASLAMAIALGTIAATRYIAYQAKSTRFQKNTANTLFFRAIAQHRGVFQLLIDAAEEEECTEMILVYYHLLTSGKRITVKQLDAQIEAWMLDKVGHKPTFDIHATLQRLSSIRGLLPIHPRDPSPKLTEADDVVQTEVALFSYDTEGYCKTLPLSQAKMLLESIWNHAF